MSGDAPALMNDNSKLLARLRTLCVVQEVPHWGRREAAEGKRYTMHTLVREIAADMLAARSAAERMGVMKAFTALVLTRGADLVGRGLTAAALGPAQQIINNELMNFRELGRAVGELARLDALEPGQLGSCLSLADMLRRRGQLAEASGIERAVLRVREEALGPSDLETVRARGCLAATLRDLGQLQKAEALARGVLTAMQEALGDSHPDTVCARASLAETLRLSGELKGAEDLQRAVLRHRVQVLGRSHLETVKARGCLAATLCKRGELPQAHALQIEVLKALKSELGADHPDTVHACANLAVTLGDLGDVGWKEACKLQEQVLEVMMATLGPDHMETIRARMKLGVTLSRTPILDGRNTMWLAKGHMILQNSLLAFEASLGPNHPTTKKMREQVEVARHRHYLALLLGNVFAGLSIVIVVVFCVLQAMRHAQNSRTTTFTE